MEFFLRPNPPEPVPQDPWTGPVSSELDFSNETDIPSVSLTASPTCFASHVLGSPVSSRHCHRMVPTIAWPITCPKRGRDPKTKLAIKTTAVYLAKGKCRA